MVPHLTLNNWPRIDGVTLPLPSVVDSIGIKHVSSCCVRTDSRHSPLTYLITERVKPTFLTLHATRWPARFISRMLKLLAPTSATTQMVDTSRVVAVKSLLFRPADGLLAVERRRCIEAAAAQRQAR